MAEGRRCSPRWPRSFGAWCQMPQTALCVLKQSKALFANEWPPPMPGAVAVAAARNISGGVNPSVKLPAAPQPFWLEGPLEPPVGGHLTLLYAPKSLLPNIYFPEKRYHLWRSQSSLEARTASALAQVGDDFEARRCWTKEEKRIHGPTKQDPIRYWRNHCAYSLHH